MKEEIRDCILDFGADVCGFSNVERFEDFPKGFSPTDIWQECKTVISVGVALPKGLAFAHSNLVYGYFNTDSSNIVDRISFLTAKQLEREYGAMAMPIPCDAINDYQVNQKACRLNTFGKNKRGFPTVECNRCRTICPMRFGE